MFKKGFILIAGLLFIASRAPAQYWGEQVTEKSFEKNDLFFHPREINPYGITGFGNAMIGLLDDPLLLIQVNPAYLNHDSLKKHYVYTDFRNEREITDRPDYYYPVYGVYDMARSYIPYYSYYTETRKTHEPVFSGAYLFRPVENNHSVTLGITYQMVSQDEDYYAIPQDIYRSNAGYDYAGNKTAESGDIQINDVYSGQDDMHQDSHILSIMGGFKLSSKLFSGIRVGRITYSRDGGYGNQYVYDASYYYHESRNKYWTNRDQSYDHWDVSGGLQYQLNAKTSLGATGGYLTGDAEQNMTQASYYFSERDESAENWSHYYSDGSVVQKWHHDGATYYGRFNFNTQIDQKTSFHLYYQYLKEDVDITNQSSIHDTSYSEYFHKGSEYYYHSRYISALNDVRSGSGFREADRHYLTAALRFRPDHKTKIYLGMHYEDHDMKTRTIENVLADNYYDNFYSSSYYDEEQTHYRSTDESKDLKWNLTVNAYKVQIPVMFTRRLNKTFEIIFGVNRTFNQWEITEQTLAVFDYQKMVINKKSEIKTNFGERYTQPVEKKSDVSTAFLIGLNIKPADLFTVRLTAVPEYMKTYDGSKLNTFQWWMGFVLNY